MSEHYTIASHPIAALATPRFKSALAIIRLTGDECIALFAPFIKKSAVPFLQWQANTTRYCTLHNPSSAVTIDDAMVSVYKAPNSYTGQDVVEISLHGSLVAIDLLLETLYSHGFSPAEPGEFTKRAYLNGKIDLTQAEAIQSIIEANSIHEHNNALQQLSGSLTKYLDSIKQSLSHFAATCAVCLDYPDDEIQESTILDIDEISILRTKLLQAIQSYDISQSLREGLVVVIAGKTNAGKSSLFNCLLKEERAIISDIHGTTRDFLESKIELEGIPLRLFDTAGLRDTIENIELQGIEKSHTLLSSADIVLYTIDSSLGLTEEDITQLQNIIFEKEIDPKKIIVIWNKIDLNPQVPSRDPISIPSTNEQNSSVQLSTMVPLSTLQYDTILLLLKEMKSMLQKFCFLTNEDTIVINSLRQKAHLEDCYQYLGYVVQGLHDNNPLDMISLDIDSALASIGKITGEVSNEDILDIMFSNFCVGK